MEMDEQMIKRESGQYDLELVQRLYLEDQYIKVISHTEQLLALRDLSLARNEITTIQGLSLLTELRRLDLSYNNIRVVKGLETLAKLQWMDLSYNKIESLNDTLEHLRELPLLTSLKLGESVDDKIAKLAGVGAIMSDGKSDVVRPNPCCTHKKYPLAVFESLPQLAVLDGSLVELYRASVLEELLNASSSTADGEGGKGAEEPSAEDILQADSWFPSAASASATATGAIKAKGSGATASVAIAGLCGPGSSSAAFAAVVDTQAVIAATLQEECSHLLRRADRLIADHAAAEAKADATL
jgi:hypothetical protein